MDKETKIELLKILAMVVILILLIIGIVWMNKEDTANVDENQDIAVEVPSENNDDISNDTTVNATEASNASEEATNSPAESSNETVENTTEANVVE